MALSEAIQVKLDPFEGSLEHLVHLAQKKEVDLKEIPLHEITSPFLENWEEYEDHYETASDFILLAAHLTWLKSKFLLPPEPGQDETFDIEDEAKFNIIHHLIDYSRFKEAAVRFSKLEMKQDDHFTRGVGSTEVKLPTGLESISLEELKSLFQTVLIRAEKVLGTITEEEFRVQDKIMWLTEKIRFEKEVPFLALFQGIQFKVEMIVLFLAILELIKVGDLKVARKNEEVIVYGERV